MKWFDYSNVILAGVLILLGVACFLIIAGVAVYIVITTSF